MSRLRVAFVGCGGIGDQYLNLYREMAEVQVCIDVDDARAKRSADMVAARASRDFADALGPEIDVVVINTPNHLHRPQAVAALEAGKHLLLQKPIAAHLADAEAIAAAARQARERGVFSGLYMSYFDQPLMHDLREMIARGWFGEIAHLYARLMHRGGFSLSEQAHTGKPNWRASLAETGGGCFIQLAVHYIHLFKWMMNAKVVRVTAMSKNLFCPGVEGEDLASAILEFSNGAHATIDTAWNTAGELLSIHGTKGTCEYIGNRMLLLDSSAGEFIGEVVRYVGAGTPVSPAAPGTAVTQQHLQIEAPTLGSVENRFNQHRMFLDAVEGGRDAFVSIDAGVDDLRIVQAVYEAARSGQVLNLS
jgi:predicted dehydrogenase